MRCGHIFSLPGTQRADIRSGERHDMPGKAQTETVARILGADPIEIVFTAGGTEANSLAISGLAQLDLSPAHVVSSSIEHPAVTYPIASLVATGFTVEYAPVSKEGLSDVSQLGSILRPETQFVTMMLANNETGAIQPVRELASIAAKRNIPVHTDAVQAVGRIPVSFHDLGVTTLAASAHKFHGPPGIGLLLVKSGVRLNSWRLHGDRKRNEYFGTAAVPLAVGLAVALEKSYDQAVVDFTRWRYLQDRLELGLVTALGAESVIRNGPVDDSLRLPQTVNLGFPGIDGDALLMQLDLAGIAVSLGSACASRSTKPSPTLVAMNIPDDWLRSSVRFSFGFCTKESDIDKAITRIIHIVSVARISKGSTSKDPK